MNQEESIVMTNLLKALAESMGAKLEINHYVEISSDDTNLIEKLKLLGLFVKRPDPHIGLASWGKMIEAEVDTKIKPEGKSEWIPESENVVPDLGELDDPAEEGKPRRVCLGCLRLFHPHRANQMVCSKTCGMKYQQRKNRNELVGRSFAFRDERRHWEYGDEAWFKMRLSNAWFPEGSRVLTPEHNLRIIRFSGGQWCYDEVMTA